MQTLVSRGKRATGTSEAPAGDLDVLRMQGHGRISAAPEAPPLPETEPAEPPAPKPAPAPAPEREKTPAPFVPPPDEDPMTAPLPSTDPERTHPTCRKL